MAPERLNPKRAPIGWAPWWCGGGLLLELPAFALALTDPQQVWERGGILLLHALACTVMALGLHRMMPPSQQQPRRAGQLFLFAITFFVPLFGALGMLAGVLVERYVPNQPLPPRFRRMPFPELPHQPSTVTARPQYGDGALSAMLHCCPNPERRLSAVLAVRHLRDHTDAAVLRVALTDAVDDVRLLAYSILDHKEQAYNRLLKTSLGQLQAAALDSAQCAKLHQRLAQIHFEMIELGLSHGEMQTYLLSEARRYIDEALKVLPDDCGSLFLLGSIALRQDELATAEKAFLRAQVLGMALEKVLPYLAKVAFLQRRFTMVTHYLRAIDPLYFHTQPLLSEVAAHWLPEEG